MINLTPIAKKLQERMREKMDAFGRETPYYPDSKTPKLTQEKMLTRTTFTKMVSGQKNPVILMGGELVSGGTVTDDDGNPLMGYGGDHIAAGYDDIYGSRYYSSDYDFDAGENKTKRPMPGIKSLSAQFMGGTKAHREATISWTCWGFDDVERLMPHFLAHGKSVMIQWGWVYDKNTLQNIRSYTDGNEIEEDAYNSNHLRDVIEQNGDYDMMTGVIKNFSFTTRPDGGFDCETIITSVGVNILSSTEGTISSIDPVITYELSKQADGAGNKTNEFKLRQAEQGTFQDSDDIELVNLNSTVSLKIFLKNMDTYIQQKINESNVVKISGKEERTTEKVWTTKSKKPKYDIQCVPNKYITLKKNYGEKSNAFDFWVRWGWFEDNILSKFLSVTSKESGKIISMFRSVERKLDPDTLQPTKENSYVSTKIKSHPAMQTLSINDYILPGKFEPQTEKFTEEFYGQTLTFNGDKSSIQKLASIINDETNFKSFEINDVKEKFEGSEEQNLKLYKDFPEMKGQSFETRKKQYDKAYPQEETSKIKYGYMRNMLINTRLIRKAFGIGDDLGVESINIFESIESLFELLNNKINFWQFKLVSDEVETYRLKIIDSSHTWIDFQRPPNSYATNFDDNGQIFGKPGIFYFPVWTHNSIVKGQSLTAKIPSSMQLAAMYGSNLDNLKSFSKSSFQDVVGAAAGGLFNDREDKRNKGLDLAYQNFPNIGTKNGFADEVLNAVDGDDITTFIITQGANLTKTLNEDLNDVAEKLSANFNGNNEINFDSSTPPPFFNELTSEQRRELFSAGSGYSSTGPNMPIKLAEEYKDLFSSKYDKNGDMRNEYIGTISALITFWDDDNTNDNRPLEMLFDLGLDVDGIGGIQPGNSFHSVYLPNKYKQACVFQATNVEHSVDSSGWTTTITGMMRSTLGYIFDTRTISEKTKDQLKNLQGNIGKINKKKLNPNKNSVEEINKKLPEMKSL